MIIEVSREVIVARKLLYHTCVIYQHMAMLNCEQRTTHIMIIVAYI